LKVIRGEKDRTQLAEFWWMAIYGNNHKYLRVRKVTKFKISLAYLTSLPTKLMIHPIRISSLNACLSTN